MVGETGPIARAASGTTNSFISTDSIRGFIEPRHHVAAWEHGHEDEPQHTRRRGTVGVRVGLQNEDACDACLEHVCVGRATTIIGHQVVFFFLRTLIGGVLNECGVRLRCRDEAEHWRNETHSTGRESLRLIRSNADGVVRRMGKRGLKQSTLFSFCKVAPNPNWRRLVTES